MDVKLAALADYAATSSQDDKLILAGVFDAVFSQVYPVTYGRTFLAFRVHFGPTEGIEHTIQVQLVDPDGNRLVEVGGPIELPDLADDFGGDAQFVMDFAGLPLPAPGVYAFDVFIDEQFVQTVDLYAWQVDAEGNRIPQP